MKKNRQASFKKLMTDRAVDMARIFGDAPPTEVAIERIKQLKGVKRFFYLLMLIVESDTTNKEKYRMEFELAMTHYQHDKVSGKHLQDRADQIINDELKIVEPDAKEDDYVDFEEVNDKDLI
jgi:hypothetical protein